MADNEDNKPKETDAPAAEPVDQPKPSPVQATDTPIPREQVQDLAKFSKAKRDLVVRKQENTKSADALKKELDEAEKASPIEDVRKKLEGSLSTQETISKELEEGREQIRAIKIKRRELSETLNTNIKYIRDEQLKIAELKDAIKTGQWEDPESGDIVEIDDEQKEAMQSEIELGELRIRHRRTLSADTSAKMAAEGVELSKLYGTEEKKQAELSEAKKEAKIASKDIADREEKTEKLEKLETKGQFLDQDLADFDERQKEKARYEADRFTPQMLENQFKAQRPVDPEYQSYKAGQEIKKAGGTLDEQQEVQQATSEFYGLFSAIKEVKKALAEMTEGTEEYVEKQEELSRLQGQAGEASDRIDKIEKQVERRGAGMDPGLGAWLKDLIRPDNIMRGAGAVAGFAGDMTATLGPQAAQRYVLEEEKKQSKFNLQNMALSDTRNRTTDATAFLSSGGGSLFGSEMPFNRKGQTTGAIKALGKDFADAQEAVPQYEVGWKAAQDVANLGANVVGKGIEGAGINGIAGVSYAAGEAIRGGAGVALNTARNVAMTPELAGRLRMSKDGTPIGNAAAQGMRSINESVIGGMSDLNKFAVGGALEWGGGDRKTFEGGSDKVAQGSTSLANATLSMAERAYESVPIRNELVNTQQQTAQAQRIRERLSMAHAPALQEYMDMQGSQGTTLRSRVMSRSEREKEELNLEKSGLDSDLTSRGFSPAEILQQTAQTSQMFGRFGEGGVNTGVTKSAMMAESMGLGPAGRSAAAMGNMLTGGVKDPEALFTKAVKDGLQKGLQDSREFQGLLDAAISSADSSAGFEGTLTNLLKLTGSGRASDIQTAQAAYKGIQQDMSGFSGDWTDMVKFDVTNRAAQDVAKEAKAKGIELSREDMTSLQNLANVKPEDLQNPELLKNLLTPGALKAVEASGGVKNFGEKLNTTMMAHGTMDRAINATQSEDLAQVRNMLGSGDTEGLKKMFGRHEGASDKEKAEGKKKLDHILALNLSGMTATGDIDRALGATQGLANSLGNAVGMDTQEMRLYQDKYKRKDIDQVRKESAGAQTFSEQTDILDARMKGHNLEGNMSVLRDKEGRNLGAAEQTRGFDQFVEQKQNLAKNITEDRTVKPELKIERVDEAVLKIVEGLQEMQKAFKDFKPTDMVVNAGKDIVIQGASAIKGVILDNALSEAAADAGKKIAGAVSDFMSNGPFGGSSKGSGGSKPQPGGKAPGSPVTGN